MNESLRLKCDLFQRRALTAGGILLALGLADGFRVPEQFFRSYLLGFVFWIGFPLGCAAFLMIHYLTGGNWGLSIKRPLEAGVRTFPIMVLFLVPLLLGITRLFSWSNPREVASDPVLQMKHIYLNVPFFLVRELIYFSVWLWIAYRLSHWSAELDRTGDPAFEDRLEGMSGPALVGYGLTITFFSIDWVMSLEPHWFSTIFGMIFMVVQIQVAIAFVTVVARTLGAYEPVSTAISALGFNDLGNLLLTFVMLWAYLQFSQFLIIWAGDLIKEIPWYVSRSKHGWSLIALCLIIFDFAVPFVLLLMRDLKRRATVLAWVSFALVVFNFVDIFWLIVPSFLPKGPRFYALDFLLPAGLGCVWLAFYVSKLKSYPLLPDSDPRFAGVLKSGD